MLRNRFYFLLVVFLMLSALVTGCGGSENPADPPSLSVTAADSGIDCQIGTANPHSMWGFWWVYIDPANETWDIVPSRETVMHANIRRFLEDGVPCTDCLAITDFAINPDDTKSVDIQVTHPWPGLDKFTGFDVRCIVMWNGSEVWEASGLRTQAPDGTDGCVLNPDGYTTVFNPTDFPPGADIPIFSYSKGKFATPVFPDSTLNPYIDYYTDENRHMFRSGQSITETWEMKFPSDGPFVLGYAVDASWEAPDPSPPEVLPDDFPIHANKPEPYHLSVVQKDPLGMSSGSETDIEVTVWDWQNDPGGVRIECPELWSGNKSDMMVAYDPDYVIFYVPISNETGAPEGTYRALIAASDSSTSLPPWDNTTYTFFDINVAEKCCQNPPVAIIENAVPIITGQELTLSSGSYDPDGDDCMGEVSWDLDCDGIFEVVGDEAVVSWDEIGEYPVTLKVMDTCDLETYATEIIEVHIGVTQPEDVSYKTFGTKYKYLSVDMPAADAAWAVPIDNPDGPWDFPLLTLQDNGNNRSILDPDHPEVLVFKDEIIEPFDHVFKTEGIYGFVAGALYVAEDYASDPDRLLWVAMHESEEFGTLNFSPVIEQLYPFWIYSSSEYYIGYPPIFEFSYSMKGWGEGVVTVPYNDITNEPCVVIAYKLKIITPDIYASGIVYEWLLDDGTSVAAVAAVNYEDEINYDEETGEITGVATYNALFEVVPY